MYNVGLTPLLSPLRVRDNQVGPMLTGGPELTPETFTLCMIFFVAVCFFLCYRIIKLLKGSINIIILRKETLMGKIRLVTTITCVALLLLSTRIYAADDIQKQVDDIRGALPKFAIPMREVGDRFQNMYFAAKGGNWALAAYMSKYMNGAMNPAKVTKPTEYEAWKNFYTETFAPVNKAIQAQDWKAFEKEYTAVIPQCNSCHSAMGYDFIKLIRQDKPADQGIDYKIKTKAADVPK